MLKRVRRKRRKGSVGHGLTLFLLILYLAGFPGVEIFHSITHDSQKAVSHSERDEKDPCHRSIYHADVEEGCDHDLHFIAGDKCPMCDMAIHSDENIFIDLFSPPVFLSTQFSLYKSGLDGYYAVISSSRAPPAYL